MVEKVLELKWTKSHLSCGEAERTGFDIEAWESNALVDVAAGAASRAAILLLEWAPTADVIRIAEAVRRLFDRLGDRRDRRRARLRFVVERLGAGEFRTRFRAQYAAVVDEGIPDCPVKAAVEPGSASPAAPAAVADSTSGLAVVAQRQEGRVAVPIVLPLGFVSAAQFAALADVSERCLPMTLR